MYLHSECAKRRAVACAVGAQKRKKEKKAQGKQANLKSGSKRRKATRRLG